MVLSCPAACAQSAAAPAAQRAVSVQGSIRSRLEAWKWFEGTDGDPSYAFLGTLARLSFSRERPGLDWQLEFAAPLLLGLPNDAVAPGAQAQLGLGAAYYVSNDRSRNTGLLFLKQAFVRFKNLGGKAHSLRLGRFEFIDGSEVIPKNATLAAVKRDRIFQRLIGAFGWSHVGRSFDGFHYALNRPSGNVTVVGAFPTRGVFQVDGWGSLHTALLYAAATKPVASGRNNGELRLLGIYYHDWRHVLKTDNRPLAARRGDLANIRIGSFGGHYIHAVETAAGPLDFLLWGNLQTGRWGRLDHRAGAVAIEAGWQPLALPKLRPWLRGGFFHSSGDDDPLDSTHGAFFQILPTPRPYARFPFYNLMNNEDAFLSLTVRPHKNVTLSGEVRSLRLSSGNDLWYLGGGAFQPWTFGYVGRPSGGGRGLASLYDVSADLRVNAHLGLNGYFGYANGKSVVSGIYRRDKNARFGYLELLYRF